jgi:hypothetical protein
MIPAVPGDVCCYDGGGCFPTLKPITMLHKAIPIIIAWFLGTGIL